MVMDDAAHGGDLFVIDEGEEGVAVAQEVVVDETVIEGDAEPFILYENTKQAVGASD